jgi:hypothetical protein
LVWERGRKFFEAADNDGDRRLPPAGKLLLQPNAIDAAS